MSPPLRQPISGIASSHGFSVGNKRTAWVIVLLFLAINGGTLVFKKVNAINFMLAVADRTMAELQADWAGYGNALVRS